jgi:septum formation protein
LTRFLAIHKAESLTGQFPKAVILGCDQIAAFEGRRLDKPGSRAAAIDQLLRLQARRHTLVTSLAVIAPKNKQILITDTTTLQLRKLSREEIEAYVDQDKPFDCAGSYKIECAGLALIERLETCDPSAIQGVPLMGLTHAFMELGLSLNQIWNNQLWKN